MSTTLVRGAYVVTVDPRHPDGVQDIVIEGSTITALQPPGTTTVADTVIEGTGHIAVPGFVDTHRHTWQSALRHGYADLDPLQYFAEMLRGIGAAYEPEDVAVGNELGALSALSAGTTTLLDWSHIQNSPEHADAAIQGLRAAGGRAVFAHGWPLTDDGSWTEASTRPHPEDIRRIQAEHFGNSEDLLTLAMAARGPEMATRETWLSDLELARELGIRTTMHVGAYAHNASRHAVSLMHKEGVLGPDLTFVHCCGCTDEELDAIAGCGATVSLGVQCEMNSMGMGDIPLDRLLARGLRPSLSGDTETKCSGDMFTQMRLLFAYYRSWLGGGHSRVERPVELTLRDVLAFATIEGARATGQEDRIGSLAVGKQADLVLVRATDLNMAPVLDPVAAIVLAAHEGNVDTVLVAGRTRQVHGRLQGVDEGALVSRACASQRRILARKSGAGDSGR
jgi:cytosine/adenosine deaminase-related metal-dependent hydrolase